MSDRITTHLDEICEVHGGPWGSLVLCDNCTQPDGTPKLSPQEVEMLEHVSLGLHTLMDALVEVAADSIEKHQEYAVYYKLLEERGKLKWWQFWKRHQLTQLMNAQFDRYYSLTER